MPDIEYRMFFDDKPATFEQLNSVEEITVEQEVDMACEARIEVPIRLDEDGKWIDENSDFIKPFSRVRVEVKNGDGPFVALIDGPIIGSDGSKNSEPGQSSTILIVQDDSTYLHREEIVSRFENKLDHEIAEQIFNDFRKWIASTQIRETPSSGSALKPVVIQRGTAMQLLRTLAKRQGMHAYVLPGDNPGQSIGCFKPFTTETDGLPPLILLGANRNMETFNIRKNAQSPSIVKASTLSITDKKVITRESYFREIDLLGDETAFEKQSDTGIQLLPPYQGESVDLAQAVLAAAEDASYAFEATGNVRGQCYQGILQPYRVVTVMAGNTESSGDYLITKVTHNLTRSNYSQSFSLKRNARSSTSPTGSDNLKRSIF